jgi:hypothetical protein
MDHLFWCGEWCITDFFHEGQCVYRTVLHYRKDLVCQIQLHKWFSDIWLVLHDCAMQPWVSENSWPVTAFQWFPTSITHEILLLPLLQFDDHHKAGTTLSHYRDTTEYSVAATGHCETGLPHVHWKVEGLLVCMHTNQRIILWKR